MEALFHIPVKQSSLWCNEIYDYSVWRKLNIDSIRVIIALARSTCVKGCSLRKLSENARADRLSLFI